MYGDSSVPRRRLRTAELVFLNLRMMGSEKRHAVSAAVRSKTSVLHKDKRVKSSMDTEDSEDSSAKVDATKGFAGIEGIRTDPSRLDSMTVKDLRTLTRSVGIPTKGNKKDLVSALKSFSMQMESASAGKSLIAVAEDTTSAVEPVERKSTPSKRKGRLSSEDNAQSCVVISEASEKIQKRTRRKKQMVESTSIEEDSKAVVTDPKLSTETEKVIDAKRSRITKRTSSKIQHDVSSMNEVGLPVDSSEPWTILEHKKPRDGWVAYNPRTMRPPPLSRDTKYVKLMSWNVNGLRALLKMESLAALQLAQREDFDVLCLQETKIQEKDVKEIKERLIDGYDNSYWTCSVSKLGYSGTAIISRIKPVSVRYGLGTVGHDSEGRLVTVEFDKFYLIGAYVPNSGEGLKRLDYRVREWDASLSNYMKDLEKSKPVILTGDLNCAHEEIDIHNPAGNRRSAGFTDEERESFEMNFLSRGLVDTFRKQHPGVVGYTYWGYRHGGRRTNKGWRLDYFLVSESIADEVYDSYIVPDVTEVSLAEATLGITGGVSWHPDLIETGSWTSPCALSSAGNGEVYFVACFHNAT